MVEWARGPKDTPGPRVSEPVTRERERYERCFPCSRIATEMTTEIVTEMMIGTEGTETETVAEVDALLLVW